MSFLKLIRYQNLIFIAIIQIIIRYGLFIPLGATIALSNFQFSLLVLATLCIAAAGNIINDIYDIKIDLINKPDRVIVGKSISEKNANFLFILLNVIGVSLGFYLSNLIEKPEFSGFFIVISALLYLYASFIKSILIISNLIISLLVASSLLIVGLFDLFPVINLINQDYQSIVFKIVLNYALFAFYINLMREIVKDIEDVNGDKNLNIRTLPIAIGRKRSAMIVFGMGIFLLFSLIYYIYEYLYNYTFSILYFLLLIIAPLLYFCLKLWDAESKNDYQFLSKFLKIIMFLGMCSMFLYTFEIY